MVIDMQGISGASCDVKKRIRAIQDKLDIALKHKWETGDKSPIHAKIIIDLKSEIAELQFEEEFNKAVKEDA